MSFGNAKQDFSVGDWVKLGNTIGGVTAKDIVDFYIVIMAQPIPKSNWVAISLIETCLEPYDVQRGRMDSLGTMPDGSDS